MVAALCALAVGGVEAVADVPLPYQQNGVVYMSGGVWSQGVAELQAQASSYPLQLVFDFAGGADGASVVGDIVVIRDSAGDVLLRTVTNGPLFLARIPPGVYDISVTHQGRQYARRAVVDPGRHERIVFGDG